MLGLDPAIIVSRIIILLIALPVHEFAHAWTANLFGDDTPRQNGRLTLNPLAHLDLMGTIMLLVAGFGWARPVPVNPYALRRRSSAALMWVSLAGPLSNFLLALLASIPLRAGLLPLFSQGTGILPSPSQFLLQFIWVNLALMLFNLLPLAPLDGDKVADHLLPPRWSRALEVIRPYGPILLLVIILVGPMVGFDLLGTIISPVLSTLTRLLLGVPT